jgi:4-carboxymuconolactone decarboxylase
MTMNSSEENSSQGPKLPKTFRAFVSKFPEIGDAHEKVAQAVDKAGPLDRKTCELIKIGISLGAGLESAVKSHVRRALEHGATTEQIEQAILLGINTRGFPAAVAAWQWAWEQIQRERSEQAGTLIR